MVAQPTPWGSLGLAGAAMGAAGQEGVCRTCSAEWILMLAVGPLPAHQHLCPPSLPLQHWGSLRALKFVTQPHGRLEPWGWEGMGHRRLQGGGKAHAGLSGVGGLVVALAGWEKQPKEQV